MILAVLAGAATPDQDLTPTIQLKGKWMMLKTELDESLQPVNLEELCNFAIDYAATIGVRVDAPENMTARWYDRRNYFLQKAMDNCDDPEVVEQMIDEIWNQDRKCSPLCRLDLRPYLN